MEHSGLPVLKNMSMYTEAGHNEGFHYHRDAYSLLFIHARSVILTINNHTHKFEGIGCVNLPPRTSIHIQSEDLLENLPSSTEQLRFYACNYEWICEDSSTDASFMPMLAKLSHSVLLDQVSSLYDSYENRLYNSLSQRLPLQAQFLSLFADACWALEQPDSLSFTQPLDGISQVISYLHTHYERKIKREDVVCLSGLSLRQFTLSFKQRTGTTFTEYLNRIRIDKVKTILLQTPQSLNEVAREVGYADEFYLSRKFKQVTGVSPTIYLRKPHTIASLDHAFTLDLLSLGVKPTAAITDTWVNDQFQQLQGSRSFQPLYWETEHARRLQVLQNVKPDIILLPLIEGDEYEQMEHYHQSGLVIQIPWRGVTWKQHFMNVAQITGTEQHARDWLDSFDHRAGQVREALCRLLGPHATVAIINVRSNRSLIYAYGYMGADLLYDILQLTRPRVVASMYAQGLEHPEFSIPDLTRYDADHYFVSIENNQAAKQRAVTMMRSPEWLALTAGKQQCVYPVEMTKWYGYGPAALDAQLNDVIHYLLPNYPKKQRII
ncbi:helix-turn-helix domain-containing protein [Paenibacillus qinlingensis]|uniref:helix-turn-helix domain-containing protein n=1 Tax=Paenibacillus qinlingensis TaxID=1837343 RepID=UPI00156421E0|nr:helix-turn-helix domain-containing protein [Paenibacillus qinlingensis]NQX61749.1 helix-turn-helix domain-containing protein [Paenibacillus qinlingensis]